VGETRVDLLHLLEDLRDAYPGDVEETILTEIVANALDSGATAVSLRPDAARATLTIADDGAGMRRRELARYHDIAASTKVRGAGIGFAGVGVKIALLVCAEVVTETRRGSQHVASEWRLASRHRAPWRWIPPPGLMTARGTAVSLRLDNALSPLLDRGFIEATLRRHFQPLLEPALADILADHYPRGVRLLLDGAPLAGAGWQPPEPVPLVVRVGRRRKPSAVGFLYLDRAPLPEDRQGVAVSTLGKIIRRGWDWLGLTPGAPDRIGGLVEVPALAECLTLNKADFIRSGARGGVYLAFRKAIQEAVSRQLAAWGDLRGGAGPDPRRASRPVERDLETVVMDLAARFPLLASLVEQRAGGQRRLPIGAAVSGPRSGTAAVPDDRVEPGETPGAPPAPEATAPRGADAAAGNGGPDAGRDREPPAASPADLPSAGSSASRLPGPAGARRPARYGLSVQFERRPGDAELARLVESTVWVNEAHPAYERAVASRSEGYHLALACAMALAPLAAGASEHAFVSAFLAAWGSALHRRQRRR
jgi:hypothetical protein